ncbi:hypothetical protein [Chryseobacterium sp.]|uniref:hypothetical protein n=1 Tax=Chryseobacterium sp. TaxID=1871047 RepID=UPI00262BD88B|nr:hypothetical protein [Chryseobacterium sp.]
MNYKLNILALALSTAVSAQIGIEKSTIDGSGLLDFPSGTTKGIILPQVQNAAAMSGTSGGTFIFDGAASKVKFHNGSSWIDLTNAAGVSKALLPGSEQNRSKGVIMGAPDSSARGVLILESTDKALILPKVINPAVNVKSPVAGMMCYDPTAKLVCFYNGTEWSFWGNTD